MKIIQSLATQIEIGDITKSTFANVLELYSKANIIIIVDENTHDYCLEFLITNFSDKEFHTLAGFELGSTLDGL